MKFFPTRTTFLQIGSFTIQWYAVLIMIGAVIAYFLIKKDLKAHKYIDVDDFMDDYFVAILWFGLIGCRLWYCLFYNFHHYFVESPLDIIRIWDGGLAIHGGIVAGLLTTYFFCKRRNVSFLKVCDCVLPNVLIAQAWGRWGNFVNKECHGPMVDESYFDGILSFLKDGMYIGGNYYKPLFFYESMLCLIGFILIRYIVKKQTTKRGQLASCYLMWYGVVRFFIEATRTDSLMIGSFKTAQLTSIIALVIGLCGYFGLLEKIFKNKKPTIIFDLDGTLVDTSKAIIEGYRYLFKMHDKEENFTPEREVEVLGPALSELFPKYFPNEDVDKLIEEYHDENARLQEIHNKAMNNALTVLSTLDKEGYDIGIVSTKSKEGVKYTLKTVGLEEYIDDIVGVYDVVKLKPNPEGIFKIIKDNKWYKDDVVYIGDSIADIGCGYNYGAYTIAYHSNPGKDDALNATKANRHITDLGEILDIIKEKHYFTYNEK